MNGVFVGLGSNMGDRERAIRRALSQLDQVPATTLRRVSSLYDTDPVGRENQPDFLNAVAELSTDLDPHEILWHLMLIEKRLGRRRDPASRWGPREIDLDLLLHGHTVISDGSLTVPHRELHQRGFVLVPLCELEPGLEHPSIGATMRQLLTRLEPLDSVRSLGRFWYQDVR